MSKVTSKLQVTIPKAIAAAHGIQPGTEVFFETAGDTIRLRMGVEPRPLGGMSTDLRVQVFDQATERQAQRNPRILSARPASSAERGWRREDLYTRGLAR